MATMPGRSGREETVIQPSPRRSAIPVGKLKEVLAQLSDDHCVVPSQVYDFFVVDKEGHNRGYISASGELHWWPVKEKGPLPVHLTT